MRLLLTFLLFPALVFAQTLQLLDKSPLIADRFLGVDSYKNTYFIKNNSIIKETDGKQQSFAAFTLGEISEVDIINPLKIMVYYADFNTVVLLDNTLNEIERINFNLQEGFANIELVSVANNNSLWVFNKDTQQLEIFNYRSGKRTVISQPVVGDIVDFASNFNFCHLLTNRHVVSYNVYGSMLEQYQNPDYTKIWIGKNGLVGLGADGKLYLSHKPGVKLELPKEQAKITLKDLQLSHDFLYIYDGEFVYTFKLT